MVAYDKACLKIMLNLRREADGSTTVVAKFGNHLDAPMTNFVFEAAVPKYADTRDFTAFARPLGPIADLLPCQQEGDAVDFRGLLHRDGSVFAEVGLALALTPTPRALRRLRLCRGVGLILNPGPR